LPAGSECRQFPGKPLSGKPAGKGIMIFMGLLGLVITGLLLSRINWRSRDFNLKVQRRNIRLVNLPKGRPAVPVVEPAANEG